MGRTSHTAADLGAPIKFRLSRVHLDSGGYDSGGAYWGHGGPLYQAEADAQTLYDDGPVTWYLRAPDREHAKAQIRAKYPNATFYR